MLLRLAFFLIFAGVVSSIRCGFIKHSASKHPISRRIIGGVDAKEGSWPWLVALASRKMGNYTNHVQAYFKCGGALISHRHVLTAAHCYDENLYLARLGTAYLHSVSPSTVDVLIEKTIVHHRFDIAQAYNDIAIVVLKKQVKFTANIRPICLPTNNFFLRNSYEKIKSTVAGWGDVKYGSQTGSNLLQEVYLPVFNLNECQEIYKKYNTDVTSKNICMGYKTGGKDACQGDSGGPLMARESAGKPYYVIGIISHGLGCGQQGVPGVYTRVSSYLPWIKNILRRSKRKIGRRSRYGFKKKIRQHSRLSFSLYRQRKQDLKGTRVKCVYDKVRKIELTRCENEL